MKQISAKRQADGHLHVSASIRQPTEYDLIVLGAGVAGLTAAAQLSASATVCVVDEFEQVGGNHKSFEVGGFSFDIGTIFFRADDPLFKMFPAALHSAVVAEIPIQKLRPDGTIGLYPISLGDAPSNIWSITQAALSLAYAKYRYRRPRDTAEFAKYYMGAVLYEDTGLSSYISRMFGVDGTQLGVEFAYRRMDWVRDAGSLRKRARSLLRRASRLGRRREPSKPTAATVVRPVAGFQGMYGPIVASLEAAGVRFSLGAELLGIDKTDRGFVVRTAAGDIVAKRLISTIPLDRAAALLGLLNEPLPHAGLTTLFFSFKGTRGFAAPVLYNYAKAGRWKRLTMHSDYYGMRQEREYFSVEVPTGLEPAADPALEYDFRLAMREAGLFLGELRFEGSNHLDTAYPVYLPGVASEADERIEALRRVGVETAGRQGRFDYLPTAKLTVKQTTAAISEAAAD